MPPNDEKNQRFTKTSRILPQKVMLFKKAPLQQDSIYLNVTEKVTLFGKFHKKETTPSVHNAVLMQS